MSSSCAARQVVQPPRHELLAGAGLAEHEHRRARRRDPGDLLPKSGDAGARAEQRRRLLGRLELARHPPLRHRAAHREQQVGPIRRLGQVGRGPGVETLLGGERVAVAGEDDHRDLETALLEVLEQPEPVHARHLDVEQGGVGLPRVEQVERLKRVARLLDLVDDENPAFHGAMVAAWRAARRPPDFVRGITRRAVLPAPSATAGGRPGYSRVGGL